MRDPLHVLLYDVPVATLHDGERGPDWVWHGAAAQQWGEGARNVANILPIQGAGRSAVIPSVRAFISGLLPEGNVRSHMAFDAGVGSDDVFGLIRAYGRDTAGALRFLPLASTSLGHYEALAEADIEHMLQRALDGYSPEGLQSTSLAGVQPKIALFRDGSGRWLRCVDGAPSTHILKVGQPAGSPVADVIDTEAACLDLARRVGLGAVEAEIETFGSLRALVVTRFDRIVQEDGSVVRVHQEDSAQAMGIDTGDMDRKFQFGKKVPALRVIADVLRASGAEPDRLLALTTFNVVVGNTDAHAKNIGVVRPFRGPARLADAYDIAMHGHHTGSSGRSALDINGNQRLVDITGVDLEAEGCSWGLPAKRARRAVFETLVGLQRALTEIDRARFPGVSEAAWGVVEARLTSLVGYAAAL